MNGDKQMKMFEFTGLRILHNDMISKGEKRTTFPFEYNEKFFSCIFLTDIIPYRLYLTTLGINPVVFELEIHMGYKANCYIDEYRRLINYLELEYDSNHKFIPADFFNALNKKIPAEFKHRPEYTDVLRVASKRRIIEEETKIYFCGWRKNSLGQKVSEGNLEKTRSSFGDEKANMSKDKNISSCWTDQKDEQVLKKLNELTTM